MSKSLFKFISLALSIGMVFTLLVACNSKNNPTVTTTVSSTTTSTSVPDKKPTVIRFWEDAAVNDTLTGKILKKYNEENKDNIIVVYETFGTNYGDIVNLALASGNPPDAFMISSSLSVPQLAQAGQIIPIDKYITDDLKKNLIPDAFSSKLFSFKGQTYGIPDQQIFMRLIYNEDIFKKVGLSGPPETLEQLKEYAIKISKAGNGAFYGFATYQKSGQGFPRFIDSVTTIGGHSADSAFDWKTGKFDFSVQKKSLQFLIDLEKEGGMYPGVLTLDNGVLRTLFAEGKIGMFVDGNWMFVVYGRQEMKISIPYNSAPIPIFAGEKRGKVEMRLNRAHVIPKTAPNPDLSWKVISTVLNDPNNFFTQFGDSPTKKVPFGTVEGPYKTWPGIKYFNDFENNFGFPLKPETALTKLEGQKRTDVYNSIFLGKTDIDKGLEDLTKRYNAALDKEIQSGNLTKEDITIPNFDYWQYIK